MLYYEIFGETHPRIDDPHIDIKDRILKAQDQESSLEKRML